MEADWELPSLRGTVRLGGQTKSPLNYLQCYDVEFYPYTPPGVDPVFAVCGGTFTIICRCVLEKNSTIEIIRLFENKEHTIPDETPDGKPLKYNSVAWSQAENGDPLVCVAGNAQAQINILNIRTGELMATLTGHGDDINDIAVSPVDPTILASCSADNSVRFWSLHPSRKKQPLAAICYGEGHKDQVLTLAYHRKGRYVLSAGMDLKINLWAVPEDPQGHAGTDKPETIHYPHFSTTEIHTDFIDCVQWYNDLILSHACREDKIILWRIDGFSSDHVTSPPPIPTSRAIYSRKPVTIPKNSTSSTQSAWSGRFQRLLQFDLPHTNQFYMRFSIFHELGRHPILVAGNEKSKAFFWDLQRLGTSGTGGDESQYEGAKGLPLGLPRHIREGSHASNSSSAVSAGSATTTKKKQKKAKEQPHDRGICDPFRSINAHKTIEVPKYKAFPFRHFSWSRDGQWCVGVGDCGLINIFHRWEMGVPPLSTESDIEVPLRESKPRINEEKITDALLGLCEAYEVRRIIAEGQGEPFDEVLSIILGEYVESLPDHEREFARSLEERQDV